MTASTLIGSGVGAAPMADTWGPLQHLRSAAFQVASIHLARLCDGRTLTMGFERGRYPGASGGPASPQSFTAIVAPLTMQQTIAAPTTSTVHQLTPMSVPLDAPFNPTSPGVYDVNVCGYSAFTQRGSLKVGGLTRIVQDAGGIGGATRQVFFGQPYSVELNPTGVTWSRLANEFVGRGMDDPASNLRWYAAGTQVADPLARVTNVLITAGSMLVDPARLFDPTRTYWANDSIELDDGSGVNRLVVSHANSTPDVRNESGYPHVVRQPDGSVLITGAAARPLRLLVDSGTLIPTNARRPGPSEVPEPNHGSSTTPLSMHFNDDGPYPNGSFITCGGKAGTPYESSCAAFNARTREWRHVELGVRRAWPITKLLPDGRVAIMGGLSSDGSGGQERAQVFDPATGLIEWGTASMPTKRGYHTTGVLQNDGSVFLCGGVQVPYSDEVALSQLEAAHCQAYWPDYSLKPKPTLYWAPESLALGSTFDIVSYDGSNARPVVDARLMPLPTDTHGFDSAQGNVQLRVVRSVSYPGYAGFRVLTLQMPQHPAGAHATAHTVPPGCWSLFLLDDLRVPSFGYKVKVTW